MPNRRAFLLLAMLAAGCGPSPTEAPGASSDSRRGASAAAAGTSAMPRVAILHFGSGAGTTAAGTAPPATLIRDRLAALGRVDGRSLRIEEHYAHGDLQRLDQLAREIVGSRPDVIVAIPVASTLAARRATDTIPIVMAHAGDPVGAGLVKSLSHPGGNVTGTTSMVPELGPKQLELLRQLLPRLQRLAVLMNPTNPGHVAQLATLSEAARLSGVAVVAAEMSRAQDLDAALAAIERARPDALFVMVDGCSSCTGRGCSTSSARSACPSASMSAARWCTRAG